MYTYNYEYKYTCNHVYIFPHIYLCVCGASMQIHLHIHVHGHMPIYVHIHMHVHVHVHLKHRYPDMRIQAHAYIRTYIRTYIHTYMQAYIRTYTKMPARDAGWQQCSQCRHGLIPVCGITERKSTFRNSFPTRCGARIGSAEMLRRIAQQAGEGSCACDFTTEAAYHCF